MSVSNKTTIVSSIVSSAVVAALASFAFCYYGHKGFDNIGVVDLQRVVASSKDVATLRANRETQINELKKMADDANAKIDEIIKDEEKQAATESYLAEIQAKKAEFDNAYNTELQASDAKIQNIINSVAEKKHLNVVLNKTSVVNGGVDITEAVVDLVK